MALGLPRYVDSAVDSDGMVTELWFGSFASNPLRQKCDNLGLKKVSLDWGRLEGLVK